MDQLCLNLIPEPQELHAGSGALRLDAGPAVCLPPGADEEDRFAAGYLAECLAAETALDIPVADGVADVATFLGSLVAVLAGATFVILFFGVSGALPAKVTLLEALAAMDFVHFFIGSPRGRL